MDRETITAWQKWFFLAAALEAGAAVLALARIPSEGLSPVRLGMFAFLGLCGGAALYLFVRPLKEPERFAAGGFPLAVLLAALVTVAALFLLRYLDPDRLLPVYERLAPLLVFLLLVFLQTSLYLTVLRRGLHSANLMVEAGRVTRPWLVFLIALLALLALISVTRLGLTPDPAYWGEPGIPVQCWQFVLALALGGLAFLGGWSAAPRAAWIPVLIYVTALAVWLSVPGDVLKNAFYASIDPPTYQPLPYSDSAYYDGMAQSLFTGHPYRGEIPTRPLYITLLAFLHLIFGQRYDLIGIAQTFVLAVIPVLFYWLGTKLHSRAAGLTAALLFIFREWTSLLVSSETRTSNTRMLLVDLPTLLLVLLACLFAFRWLERRGGRSAFIAGGAFGLLLLLRTQSLFIIPVILLVAALTLRPFKTTFLRGAAFFVLGLAVTVAPWLLHNYLLTGQVTFDAAFQYKVIASQYAYTGNLDIANFDFEGKGLGEVLLQFLLKDPGFVLGFIANHFLAGWVGGLLALPLIKPFTGLFAPINLYWTGWDGSLEWYNLLLVLLYLGVIALGLAACWRRWRWMGLLPLGFNIGYTLATAVGRFSGWRYDMPADWVPYFYFAMGFAELLGLMGALFGHRAAEDAVQTHDKPASASPRSLLPAASLFALLGALPWIAALFAAPQFSDQSAAHLLPRLEGMRAAPPRAQLEAFLSGRDAVLLNGRLLYPRYFYRDAGLTSATSMLAYAPRPFPRQGFLVLNQGLMQALFPTRDPLDFPQAGEVILLGCQRAGYVEARLVAFPALGMAYVSGIEEPCR